MEKLKNSYVEVEGFLEESAGDGEFQGGSVDIFDKKSVESWSDNDRGVSDITAGIRSKNMKA